LEILCGNLDLDLVGNLVDDIGEMEDGCVGFLIFVDDMKFRNQALQVTI
jgi:hypothetical protein